MSRPEVVTDPSDDQPTPDTKSPDQSQMSDGQPTDTTNDSPTPQVSSRRAIKKPGLKVGYHGSQEGVLASKGDVSPLDETGTSALSLSSTHPMMMRPVSPLNSLESAQRSISPQRTRQPFATSPHLPSQSSPRLHSSASSQIFERNVQEDIIPAQTSPSIPSHIKTENHIPPTLDASSEALTDNRLDTDSVEIVTHNSHQPASLSVANAHTDLARPSSWHEDIASNAPIEIEDSVSHSGALDPADVKRLSFVSFADLVHGEHAENADGTSNQDSTPLPAPQNSNPAHLGVLNRSPSPVQSPTSSHGLGTSPPTTMSSPLRAKEASPNRGIRVPSSPGLGGSSPPHSSFGGELNVETMTQALRRTESGDLSCGRSQPMSAVGSGDNALDRDRLFK